MGHAKFKIGEKVIFKELNIIIEITGTVFGSGKNKSRMYAFKPIDEKGRTLLGVIAHMNRSIEDKYDHKINVHKPYTKDQFFSMGRKSGNKKFLALNKTTEVLYGNSI